MKIRPVGVKLFHADGQTDRYDEANSRFSQFEEGALNYAFCIKILSHMPNLLEYRVAQKMYTLFTYQYFWNKFK
jgi:hypothetical protein